VRALAYVGKKTGGIRKGKSVGAHEKGSAPMKTGKTLVSGPCCSQNEERGLKKTEKEAREMGNEAIMLAATKGSGWLISKPFFRCHTPPGGRNGGKKKAGRKTLKSGRRQEGRRA